MSKKTLLKPPQEIIFCSCGCGQKLEKYNGGGRSRHFICGHQGRGRTQTIEHVRKRSNQMLGENHPNWKGGRFVRDKKRPYIWIHFPNHPHANSKGYIPEHRLIMERKLGRILAPKEVVHHINGNTIDNREENLQLFGGNGTHIINAHNPQNNINCWSQKEEAVLKELWIKDVSLSKILKKLQGRSLNSIRKRASKLSIMRHPKRKNRWRKD